MFIYFFESFLMYCKCCNRYVILCLITTKTNFFEYHVQESMLNSLLVSIIIIEIIIVGKETKV